MATTAALPRPATDGGSGRVSPRLVLAVILTVQLMVVIDATIVNVALPGIARALHFTAASLSWVVTGYTLAFGGLLLLGARAGDLLGRRRTFIAGIAVFTLASLAAGAAPSAGALLAARAVQGLGGALAAPSALALLMVQFSEGRARTRALGWFAAVSIGGMALGLILGGLLTQLASWRWVFFVNVPIGIALVVASRLALVETSTRHGRFDIAGAVLSTTGVSSLAYGFVSAAQNGWGDAITVLAFTAGAVLLGSFIAVEMRAEEPITPLGLFLNRTRSAAYAARLLLLAGVFGMFFFLTQFMQEVRGYGSLETGLAFLPFTLLLFVMSQLTARVLLERFEPKRLMVTGLTISTIGMVLLTELNAGSGYVAFLVPMLLFGLGNGLAFVPLTNAGLHAVPPSQAGAASGLVNVMQQLGAALGLAVLVSVFGSAGSAGLAGTAAARQAFVSGADHAFLAGAIFVGASLVLLAVAIPGRRAAARAQAIAEVPDWVRSIGDGESDGTPVAFSANGAFRAVVGPPAAGPTPTPIPCYRERVVGKQGSTVSQELPFTPRQEALLEALGDPTRRLILARLRGGPLAVVAIAAGLPVSRPAVSQHLRVLKDAGLVVDRPEANRRLYSIDPSGLAELRAALDSFWEAALSQFKDVVERGASKGQ